MAFTYGLLKQTTSISKQELLKRFKQKVKLEKQKLSFLNYLYLDLGGEG